MTRPAADPSLAPTSPRPDGRWAVLAGVRFGLAMVIVSGHLPWFRPAEGPPPALADLGGTAAVLGFLVISGYSIADSIDRRPAGFYRRRVWRIYPLYAAAVLYSLVPYLTLGSPAGGPGFRFTVPRPAAADVLGNLLLLQNVVCRPLVSDLVVWTLGVEVACYLAAPWLRRRSTSVLALAAAGSAVAYAACPAFGSSNYPAMRFGLPLLLLAWAWLAGFVLHRRPSLGRGGLIAVVGGALVAINPGPDVGHPAPAFAAVVLIVTVASRVPPLPAVVARPLNFLGDLSYPLYLFHLPTFLLACCSWGVHGTAGLFAVALAASAGVLLCDVALRRVLSPRAVRDAVPTLPAVAADRPAAVGTSP